MSKQRILVIDLDGTLCSQEESGYYYQAEPKAAMIKRVNELADSGWKIVIFTARGMNTYIDAKTCDDVYRKMTEEWLRTNGVTYHELIFGKPAADMYVDDKALGLEEFANENLKRILFIPEYRDGNKKKRI